jgi:hypothetical protein
MMNRLETAITITLAIIVIAASIYVISAAPWFDLNPCPAGQYQVVTVWNEGTPTERTDRMCIEAEK